MIRTETNLYAQFCRGWAVAPVPFAHLTLGLLCLRSCPKPAMGLTGFLSSLSEFYLKTFLSSFRSVD